jgi:hypothetical protein
LGRVGARVSQAAHFLGYEIRTQHADAKITGGRRMVNGTIGLFMPRTVFTAIGVRIIKTPIRAPRANAIAERRIASARREYLNRMLITGERYLRLVLSDYSLIAATGGDDLSPVRAGQAS